MNQADWNRSNEDITILSAQITRDNNLNITAKNTGNIQSAIIWIGIFNQSVAPEGQWFFSVNQLVSIGQTKSFLAPFQVTPDQKYTVQLITKEGNVYDYMLYPADQTTLALSLVAVSPTVYKANNITLLLTVTNNNTEGIVAENVTVSLAAVPSTLTTVLSAPSSLTINSLSPGATTFFTWTYSATNTGTVLFEATYNSAPQGAFATASVSILDAPASGGDGEGGDGGENQSGAVTITGTNGTATYHPTQWTMLDATSHVSGTISSLAAADSNTATFASYYTGNLTVINQFVTSDASDVDSNANRGTIDNFAGMQSGPNGAYATLTEEQTGTGVTTFGNPVQFGSSYHQVKSDKIYGGAFFSGSTEASVDSITFYGKSTTGNVNVKAVICDGNGYIIPSGISDPLSIPSEAGWYTLTFEEPPTMHSYSWYWLMIISESNTVYLYYSNSYGGWGVYQSGNEYDHPENPLYVNYNYCQYSIYASISSTESCNLDVEAQWTNVNTEQENNDLGIYLASQSGSEGLAVDAWVDSDWVNVFSSLSVGWNNVSSSMVPPPSTITLRFRDTSPNDATQDSWSIDVAVLRQVTQSDQYTCAVEFTGISNINSWSSFVWNTKTSIDTNNANVTIQFYNYTSASYASSGAGYVSFVPTGDSASYQSGTLTSDVDDFKDGSGVWKVKITVVKATVTSFNLAVDWIETASVYSSNGATLSYGAIQNYIIKATSGNGGPTPYVYASIYVNGSSINLQNGLTNQSIANPAWVQLDSNGIYNLRIQSTSSSEDRFVIYVSVGTTVGEKIIVQEEQ